MNVKMNGALAAAIALVLSACGHDKAALEKNISPNKSDALTTEKASPPAPEAAKACDLLGEAIAAKDGWTSVKRGNDAFQAKPVQIGAQLIPFLKTLDNQFDTASSCLQLLKNANLEVYLEVAAEACSSQGVVNEDRAHSFRLALGKVMPAIVVAPTLTAVEMAPSEKGKKPAETPIKEEKDKGKLGKLDRCNTSRYPISFSAPKKGDRIVGELLVNLRLEAPAVKQSEAPVKGEKPSQKQEQPIQVQQVVDESNMLRFYDLSVTKLCSDEYLSACKVSVAQGFIRDIELVVPEVIAAVEAGKNTPVKQQEQQVQKAPKVETPAPKPETPVAQEPKKPETPVKQEQKQPEAPAPKQEEPPKKA